MQIVTFPAPIAVLLLAAILFLSNFAALNGSPLSSPQEFSFKDVDSGADDDMYTNFSSANARVRGPVVIEYPIDNVTTWPITVNPIDNTTIDPVAVRYSVDNVTMAGPTTANYPPTENTTAAGPVTAKSPTDNTTAWSVTSKSAEDNTTTAGPTTLKYPYDNHSWLSARQVEELLLIEGGEEFNGVDCCPADHVITAPIGGINTDGNYVTLFRDGKKRQQFHEITCKDEVVDQPCRFMEKRFHNRSRCVQKYSYSYAVVVQDPDAETTDNIATYFEPPRPGEMRYLLDYIQVRSGCSCEITPNRKLKDKFFKNKKKKRKSPDED